MKTKKILALILASVLAMSMMTGCGGGETTDEATGDDSVLKVGMLGPFTGSFAQYGEPSRDATQLYVDELNAAGGINGKQIELLAQDTKGEAVEVINAYNLLVKDGVTAIVGEVTSGTTIAVAIESVEANMPMISGTATAAEVTSYGNNMFRSCFIDPFQGGKMATFAMEELGAKTAAIIYNTGDDYSKGVMEGFKAEAEALGLEVVAVEGYGPDTVDFMGQLTNISAKTPDVLFCPDYYETIALIAQQAKNVGLTATLLGADGWDGALSVVTDPALLEGAYFCSGYSADDPDPVVQDFLKNFETAFGYVPNMFAAQTYDAANILFDAIAVAEEAGLVAGSDEYKQAVIDAMDATDMTGVTGHITFDENNNPVKEALIINITNGEYKFHGKF